ncbi:MAG: PAS domain S-box protein [Myxococcales bacterium]|nr:PAS domain S-box protein [Myxococcales bacterium]MCB9642079.1 PAS domain S-box protein [Myxococcales bacterium]
MSDHPLESPSASSSGAFRQFDLSHIVDEFFHEIYIFDRESLRFVEVNKVARENLGYTLEELRQMTPLQLKRELSQSLFERLLQPIRAGESSKIHFEANHHRKDGSMYPVEVLLQLGMYNEHEVFVAMILDITQRRRAEEALRRSEERFRTIFEQAGVGVALLHSESGAFLRLNQRYCEILGYSEEELIQGMTSHDVTHPTDLPVCLEQMERIYRGEIRNFSLEKRYVRKDGSSVWVSLTLSPIWGNDGIIQQHVATVQDITQNKEAREELFRTTTLLHNLLDSSPDMIFVKDKELRTILCNPSFAAAIGKEPYELLGKTDIENGWGEDFVYGNPEKGLRGYHHEDREVLEGATIHNPRDLALVDGEEHVFDTKKFPLRVRDGEVVGVIGISRDVTERENEEKRRQELERQVQHAQKLESLGVLAGGIAHDFNNLLTGILGYSDLALNSIPQGTTVCGYLEEVVKGARQAAALTQQMLAYSGKGRFLVKSLDLSHLVEDMGRFLEISISKKCVLRYEFLPGLPAIDADASQIRQVVMNLVINASEAIGDKSGVIAISTGIMFCDKPYLSETYLDEDLPEGPYVYIEVSDNGSGMTPTTQAKIFDPFFTTKFTGRGLGLAAVLGIVRGHKGAIKVYSEPSRGTTIKVLFPVSKEQDLNSELFLPAVSGWNTSGVALVVDDEESVRALARVMLEKMGFSVLSAADGREAVEIFRQRGEQIDLVLLDMTMPHLNGEETFREMRRIRSNVRTILSSGYNEQSATNRFAGKGLAGFIQKPYQYEGLREIVQRAMELLPKEDASEITDK